MSENSTGSLIKQFANESPEKMEEEQKNIEEEHVEKCKAMEENISAFSSKTDELKVEGKVLAVVKRPTHAQFKRFTPAEMIKYSGHPDEIPPDVAMKYEADMYALMEELIISPKHTAKEWQELTGDDFMAMFQAHLFSTRQKLAKDTAAFLQQTLDSQS